MDTALPALTAVRIFPSTWVDTETPVAFVCPLSLHRPAVVVPAMAMFPMVVLLSATQLTMPRVATSTEAAADCVLTQTPRMLTSPVDGATTFPVLSTLQSRFAVTPPDPAVLVVLRLSLIHISEPTRPY